MRTATPLYALLCTAIAAAATAQGPNQVPLPGSSIPQFVDRLPTLAGLDSAGTMTTLAGVTSAELHMREFRANVLPTGFVPPGGWPGGVPGTYVWGYISGASAPTSNLDTYIGPVFVAARGTPIQVQYVNDLGHTTTSNLTFFKYATDQTLHWADPLEEAPKFTNYEGYIAAVPHLHGGEVPPQLDGGPDAWFTSDGSAHGDFYYTHPSVPVGGNTSVFRYPNSQEAANIWFHDHTLGVTRLNVYAGLAGAYVITDSAAPDNLPGPIVPLVIQDRMFDTNGQLYFPSAGINPEHPYWVPEFVGDTIVVNGKTWPYFNVEPKPYRFLFLNGSNARTYDMFLQVLGKGTPPMWVIGTDGGYLDAPALIQSNGPNPKSLVLMPGERYEVIIDFSGLTPGTSAILRNRAKMPYPDGGPAQATTVGRIMKFNVVATTGDGYTAGTYTPPTPLRGPGGAGTQDAIVRLPGTPGGQAIAVGTNVQKVRQLTLNEVIGPGGPLEVLVNNTKWSGKSVATDLFGGGVRPDFVKFGDLYYSELPTEGDTEMWELVNMTADAHPIHLHLVQFQIVDRQDFDVRGYTALYDSLFPGSTVAIDPMTGLPYAPRVFIGGYGPPCPYNSGSKLGGNPDVYLLNARGKPVFMKGVATPPQAHEQGWKDTVVTYPGQVTRIMVRWAPTDKPLNTTTPWFTFDPYGGQGYVWHCHIIDHEDNEMMRPTLVTPKPAATRTYIKGTDY